jgi:anti-sigma regulatory factor (Ser/Thr protein kinase)
MRETLVIHAEIAALPRVFDWVDSIRQKLGLSQSTLFAIHLCLEEALSNIVLYGFADDAEGDKEVRITLEWSGDTVDVTIEDHGTAFDPLAVAAPAMPSSLEEAPVGGRGIFLMRQFAQHLAYERRDGINHLALRFACP